eukprot:80084-Hanusia_phi.AAC.1
MDILPSARSKGRSSGAPMLVQAHRMRDDARQSGKDAWTVCHVLLLALLTSPAFEQRELHVA